MFPLTREHWQAVSPYLEQAMEMSGDERRALLLGEHVRVAHSLNDLGVLLRQRNDRAATSRPPARSSSSCTRRQASGKGINIPAAR